MHTKKEHFNMFFQQINDKFIQLSNSDETLTSEFIDYNYVVDGILKVNPTLMGPKN